MKRLYVGNLSFKATQDDVQVEFSKFGQVSDCKLITDRETGQSRGFAFVTFTNDADADQAIKGTNGAPFLGRPLVVNQAEDRPPRGAGGGGGNFRSGGGGSGPRPADPPRDNGGGGGRKGGGGGGSRRQRGGDRYDQD